MNKAREVIEIIEAIRGFKNKKELGAEIEDMDMNIEDKDRKKFDSILNKALSKIDPDLAIIDAVQKLSDRDAQNLFDELSTLHYEE